MLYVTLGLAAMFGVGAFVGSAAIDEATDLVSSERLATAYTTAGIVERDFARLAADARFVAQSVAMAGEDPDGDAQELYDQLREGGRYPFFSVVGVCVAGPDSEVVGEAGLVRGTSASRTGCARPVVDVRPYRVVRRASWAVAGRVALADPLVPLTDGSTAGVVIAVVHLASANQSVPFDPAALGHPTSDPKGPPISSADAGPHYPAIGAAMASGTGIALVAAGDPVAGVEPTSWRWFRSPTRPSRFSSNSLATSRSPPRPERHALRAAEGHRH